MYIPPLAQGPGVLPAQPGMLTVGAVATVAPARMQTAVRAKVANTVTMRLRDGCAWMLLSVSPTGGVSGILMVSSPQRQCMSGASVQYGNQLKRIRVAALTALRPPKPALPPVTEGNSQTICWSPDISSSPFATGGSFLPGAPVRARRPGSADTQALQSSFGRSSTIVDALHQSRPDSGLVQRRHAPRRARECEPPTTARPTCSPSRAAGEAWTVRSGWSRTL